MTYQSNLVFLLILAVLALAFFTLGIMVRHHWKTYSPDQIPRHLLQIIYWGAGGALLGIMAIT